MFYIEIIAWSISRLISNVGSSMLNNEISSRVGTAFILVSLALGAIFSFSPVLFEFLILVISLLCTWEWIRLSPARGQTLREISLLGGMFVLIIALTFAPYMLPYVLGIAVIWWATLGLMLLKQRKLFIVASWRPRIAYAWVLVLPAAAGLCCLSGGGEHGPG